MGCTMTDVYDQSSNANVSWVVPWQMCMNSLLMQACVMGCAMTDVYEHSSNASMYHGLYHDRCLWPIF